MIAETSWLLGDGYPWRSANPGAETPGIGASAVAADARSGLTLASLPQGPLGLASPDGSLGGLTLPQGVAVDGAVVLILSADGRRVFRYDALTGGLAPLHHVGMEGTCDPPPAGACEEARRFCDASGIAARSGSLYVADPAARRVQVFDLDTLALAAIHARFEDPVDVAAGQRGVYIVDRGAGRIYRAAPEAETLKLVVDVPPWDRATGGAIRVRRSHWDRVAVDSDERIYVRCRADGRVQLDVFDLSGDLPVTTAGESIDDSGEVRGRFAAPAVASDGGGGFDLAPRLLDACGIVQGFDGRAARWEVGERLYALDPTTSALCVYLADGRLRHRFAPLDGIGNPVSADAPGRWEPADVIDADGCVLVLDARNRVVYAHQPGAQHLRRWFAAPASAQGVWRRIARDAAGCFLLWDESSDTVARLDATGASLGTVRLRDVRERFEASSRTVRAPGDARARVRLTRNGATTRPAKARPTWPEARYRDAGVWTSQWLDSTLYDCRWGIAELAIDALPPGCSIGFRSRTTNDPELSELDPIAAETAGKLGPWRASPPFAGLAQPGAAAAKRTMRDVLVPSEPGRYLQVQLTLSGDGVHAPLIGSIRLRFPHESLLQYLPAVFSTPAEQRDFVDRLLSIAQTTWSDIERKVDTFDRFLDPDSVPPDAMAWLASWLGLSLEGRWDSEQNRRLLRAVTRLRKQWGTVEGVRALVRVYLANLGGVAEEQLAAAGIPGIVESFVDRRRLWIGAQGARLGAGDPLWSPAVERRFQVGVFDQEGEVELVSTGAPELDVFRHYAHSFRVYAPAAFVRTPDDEALLRRAIEIQKPAHTSFELMLVEPRLRIGDQCVIELDTVIGAAGAQTLPCDEDADPPSRPPHQRLGFDATLGSRGRAGGSPIERRLA